MNLCVGETIERGGTIGLIDDRWLSYSSWGIKSPPYPLLYLSRA